MKILLLGEFSGVHKNLKEGLQKLGYDVVVASSGDGFKQINSDIDLSVNGNILTKKIKRLKQRFDLIQMVKEYDLVQLINPFIFYSAKIPNKLNKLFFKKLIENSKKIYMLAAGDDSYFWRYGRKRLNYGPFDDFLKYDYGGKSTFYMESDRAFEINKYVADNVNGIIPVMYEYEISYKGHKNLLNTIPLPINIDKIKYEENIVSKKLVVFHGLNRYGFKGTRHVEEAFAILSKKYPNELELIIDGKMPLEKYLKVMQKTNIVIDQTNSYSLGMNGLYAMAMGKVVLGGAEPESLKSLGVNKSPVINIKPNAQSIVEEIEKLLNNKKDIPKIGYESRKFVEDVHGYVKVAKQYLEAWKVG